MSKFSKVLERITVHSLLNQIPECQTEAPPLDS